jgi:hypothetical protein
MNATFEFINYLYEYNGISTNQTHTTIRYILDQFSLYVIFLHNSISEIKSNNNIESNYKNTFDFEISLLLNNISNYIISKKEINENTFSDLYVDPITYQITIILQLFILLSPSDIEDIITDPYEINSSNEDLNQIIFTLENEIIKIKQIIAKLNNTYIDVYAGDEFEFTVKIEPFVQNITNAIFVSSDKSKLVKLPIIENTDFSIRNKNTYKATLIKSGPHTLTIINDDFTINGTVNINVTHNNFKILSPHVNSNCISPHNVSINTLICLKIHFKDNYYNLVHLYTGTLQFIIEPKYKKDYVKIFHSGYNSPSNTIFKLANIDDNVFYIKISKKGIYNIQIIDCDIDKLISTRCHIKGKNVKYFTLIAK